MYQTNESREFVSNFTPFLKNFFSILYFDFVSVDNNSLRLRVCTLYISTHVLHTATYKQYRQYVEQT